MFCFATCRSHGSHTTPQIYKSFSENVTCYSNWYNLTTAREFKCSKVKFSVKRHPSLSGKETMACAHVPHETSS